MPDTPTSPPTSCSRGPTDHARAVSSAAGFGTGERPERRGVESDGHRRPGPGGLLIHFAPFDAV